MQISKRSDADLAGLDKYFTGKPCIRGHFAERYTSSGACSQCVIDAAAKTREAVAGAPTVRRRQKDEENGDKLAAFIDARNAYDNAANKLIEVRIRAYGTDIALLRETVVALGKARYPMLREAEFLPVGKPTDAAGGTGLYRFRCDVGDLDLVRATANALLEAHAVNVSSIRDRAIHAAEQMADDAAQSPPEHWK